MRALTSRVFLYLMVLVVFIIVQPLATQTFAASTIRYGDQNVEGYAGTIGGDLVQAYTIVTISKSDCYSVCFNVFGVCWV